MNITASAPIAVAATSSIVSASELLQKVASQYAVGHPVACDFWRQGINDTYHLRCSDTNYSMRVYRHNLRKREHIEFELAALTHLWQQGVNVARPVEKKTGGHICEVVASEGRRFVILTTSARGSTPNYSDPEIVREFGASVANIHQSSDNFSTSFSRPRLELDHLLEKPLAIIRPCMSERPDDLEFFIETADKMRSAVMALPTSSLDIGFCHGDIHGGNVHHKNDVYTHFDFDCCGFGYRAFDLATYLWSSRLSDTEQDRWPLFIEGYQSVRKISDADLTLAEHLVALRHLWWMALIIDVSESRLGLLRGRFFDNQRKNLAMLLKLDNDE